MRPPITKTTWTLIGMLLLLSTAQRVFAHGTVIYPASRIYMCYQNPSNSVCDACGARIYDWMSVLQPDTDFGNHPAFVPDGQIASGGNGGGDFSCLDALTTDWPTTTVNVGAIDVLWENTAPHKTQYYKVYITPLTWDPTQPLRWGDLIEIGSVGQGPAEPFTTITSVIPAAYAGKRAALVSVWQRDYNDSHEAFYSVSDIQVAGDGTCNPGDAANVTFANNTNCTLEYYQNNTLQGSANSGASFAANTSVGAQWEARETSGAAVDSFTIACGQSIYASTQCVGTGCTDGDPVTITFVNNTDCTVEYYRMDALQGSADAGGSFSVSTTVGSHWDVRETTGVEVSHFHIVCEVTTYTSEGSCGGGDSCAGLQTWSAGAVYVGGDKVAYNGVEYQAKWWNQGANPEQNSGEYQVWESLGSCSGGGCTTGDAVSVMFNNNTDCVLEYYQNNALQGAANAGGSFMTSTTVGSLWEARETSGAAVDSYTIACGQSNYNAAGNCSADTTGGCATAYGPYPNVYMAGDVVGYNGHNYECQVNNLFNVTPGTAAHWWADLGPCGSNGSARGIHFEEFAEDLQFTLFPNPAHDLVSLEIANPTSAAYTLTIMGMDGRTIETVVVNASEGSARVQQSISLQALSPGLYFINVTSGKQTLSQMVVKE